MCSIWGVALLNPSKMKDAQLMSTLVSNLAIEGQVRGRSATGVAVVTRKRVSVLKGPLSGREFAYSKEFETLRNRYITHTNLPALMSILGHNRHPTKGSVDNPRNNHPIIYDKIVGVHNGVITNDDELFAGERLNRLGEVDSEIIFALINKYYSAAAVGAKPDMGEVGSKLRGSYCIAFVNKMFPYQLHIFRGESPFAGKLYDKVGLFVFASTESIINKAVAGLGFGEGRNVEVDRNNYAVLNLLTCKLYKTEVKTK